MLRACSVDASVLFSPARLYLLPYFLACALVLLLFSFCLFRLVFCFFIYSILSLELCRCSSDFLCPADHVPD